MDEKRIPCPKCNRSLAPTGTINMGREEYLAYQCDECIIETGFCGEKIEVPLTFAADRSGKIVESGSSLSD